MAGKQLIKTLPLQKTVRQSTLKIDRECVLKINRISGRLFKYNIACCVRLGGTANRFAVNNSRLKCIISGKYPVKDSVGAHVYFGLASRQGTTPRLANAPLDINKHNTLPVRRWARRPSPCRSYEC